MGTGGVRVGPVVYDSTITSLDTVIYVMIHVYIIEYCLDETLAKPSVLCLFCKKNVVKLCGHDRVMRCSVTQY